MTEARNIAGVGINTPTAPPRLTMATPLKKSSDVGGSTTLSQRQKASVQKLIKGGNKLATDISEKDAFKGLRENI